MRKTTLSLSVLFALVAGTLVGCDVTSKKVDGKEVIFTLGDKAITAQDILGFDDNVNKTAYNFFDTDEGVQAVYDAIYSAMAQNNVKITDTMKAAVQEKMDNWDDEVASYADTNGVTSTVAEKTLLEEKGFEKRSELEQSYFVEEQIAELQTKYKTDRKEPTEETADGSTMLERYVRDTSPMIVKHVLVKIADAKGLGSKGTISAGEIDKLSISMQRLALGKESRNTFKNVAQEESDDSTASKGGNLGIMDTYTSYVKEFKLGLYVNEIISHDTEGYDALDTLGLKNFEEELFGENGIYPNKEVKTLNVPVLASVLNYLQDNLAEKEQAQNGHTKKAEYDQQLYPVNVIFNRFLNTPAIKYLTSNVADESGNLKEIKEILRICFPTSEGENSTSDAEIATLAQQIMEDSFYKSFKAENENTDDNHVVLDDNGKKLVFVKSEYGFHFLSVTWSALEHQADTGLSDAVKYFMYNTANVKSGWTTYVNTTAFDYGYTSTSTGKNARRNEIDERVMNYIKGGFESVSPDDCLYNHEIFNYYLAKAKADNSITVSAKLEKAVKDMIDNENASFLSKIEEAQSDSWTSYVRKVQRNQEMYNLLYRV